MALYEGMFLLDNDTVRAGWPGAKAVVTDLITKHGGNAVTARRWDERQLAYPIKGKGRATYLLVHFEMPGDSIPPFHRDLEIKDAVLRYLQLRAESVPEEEHALAAAEVEADFSVPEPPDDAPLPIAPELFAEREERRERRERREESDDKKGDDDKADDEKTADGEKAAQGEKAEKTEKAEKPEKTGAGEKADKPEAVATAAKTEGAAPETPETKKED